MGKIHTRAFGATLPERIRRKIQIMEEKGAGVGINDSQAGMEETDLQEDSFGGQGYYSSKTPFARMWTAVSVVQKTGDETEADVEETLKQELDFATKRYNWTKSNIDSGEAPKIKVTTISRTPSDKLGKVYMLGTYNMRTGDRKLYEPIGGDEFDPNSILPSQRETYTDLDYATNPGIRKLRPPAGILNVRSSTQGSSYGGYSGTMKSTVQFKVYDKEEYDQIYSRYFLRPGAQIFVDFGWTHKKNFTLYNPEDLLKLQEEQRSMYNEIIYGTTSKDGIPDKDGQIHDSDYDIQFIQGLVGAARSDFDPSDLSWNCEIDLWSHNTVLTNPTLTEETHFGVAKKNLLANLEYRILSQAANTLFPDKQLFPNEKFSTDHAEKYSKYVDQFSAEYLGSPDFNKPSQLNVELGIYWRGTYKEDEDGAKIPSTGPDAVYVSWGWFEDNILNNEFAKYFDKDDFDNEWSDSITFSTPWHSLCHWESSMYKRQTFLGSRYRKLPFILPDNWDDTYNTRKLGTDEYGGLTQDLKDSNKIPIREVFIQLKVLKRAIKDADKLSDVYHYVSRILQQDTGYVWNWMMLNQDPPGLSRKIGWVDETIGCTDTDLAMVERVATINKPESYDNLFKFNPASPNSIIRNMSMNLQFGGGDLISSEIALASLGEAGLTKAPVSSLIAQAQSREIINQMGEREGRVANYEVEYVPQHTNTEYYKLISNDWINWQNREKFPKGMLNHQTTDTGYLANTQINGDYSNDKTDIMANKIAEEINKSSDVVEEPEEEIIEASAYPTMDFAENKELLQKQFNVDYRKNTYDYFTKVLVRESTEKVPTLTNYAISLQLYGNSAFCVGDMFRIGYLPKRYDNSVFYQVMGVSHNVSPGNYETTLNCVMKLRPDVKQRHLQDVEIDSWQHENIVIEPTALSDDFGLIGINKLLPFLLYVKPLENNNPDLDFVYQVNTFIRAKTEPISELFDSIDISTAEALAAADEYIAKLEEVVNNLFKAKAPLATLKTTKSKDGKSYLLSIQYDVLNVFNNPTENALVICIKNNKWVLTIPEQISQAAKFMNILYPPPPPPSPPANETAVNVAV